MFLTHTFQPTRTGSRSKVMPKVWRTVAMISSWRRSMSAQVAPPRLMRARVWREERAAGPVPKPLVKPARSRSQAAGSLVWVLPVGQLGMVAASMCRAAAMGVRASRGTMGFLKKEPALRQSGSSSTRSIPFSRRMARTVAATSARVGVGFGGEAALEVGVAEVGCAAGVQSEADAGDDVAVWSVGVKEAGAVAEVAVGGGEGEEGAAGAIEAADGFDGLGDLLSVGADVLDGGSADEAGDAGEALDAGEVAGDGEVDEGVPGLAGGGFEEAVGLLGDAAEGDVEDEAVEAGVTDEEVAAATEDEDGQAALIGPGEGGGDVGFIGDLGEVARGAADTEGGEWGQRVVFADREHAE